MPNETPTYATTSESEPKPSISSEQPKQRPVGPSVRRVLLEVWQAEARQRFGDDAARWKFQCPACGHVQQPEDFRQFPNAKPEDAAFNCIGRFLPTAERRDAFGSQTTPKSPCNYTLGGLFRLVSTVVVDPDGGEYQVFEFADREAGM